MRTFYGSIVTKRAACKALQSFAWALTGFRCVRLHLLLTLELLDGRLLCLVQGCLGVLDK